MKLRKSVTKGSELSLFSQNYYITFNLIIYLRVKGGCTQNLNFFVDLDGNNF